MKTKKLLSVVLALVMVLSLVSFAGAATLTDVPDELAPAIARLVGLGILNGYPDGTFRPDNNITRAEFAKIAVLSMGLERSADMLATVPSQFSDVKVSDWFNKYVNVATSQGILKGYPDGTFKPNSNITQAEALTIVLRLLGYNDNLPGSWPYNYVVQADTLNLIDSGFSANIAATRGGIATLVCNALEKNMVVWNSDAGFVDQKATMLARQLNGSLSEIMDVESVTTGGKTYDTLVAGGATHNVSKEVAVAGSTFANLANHKVVLTKVNNVVVAIEVKSTLVTGEVTKVAGRTITIGNTDVVLASGVTPIPAVEDVVSAWIYDGRAYKVIVHADAQAGVIAATGVNASGQYVVFGEAPPVYFAANAAITLNGAPATFASLAVGQYAVYELNNDTPAKITKLDAYNNTVNGVVDSWTAAGGYYTSITINGVEYKCAANTVAVIPSMPITVGASAMLTLNTRGEVVAAAALANYAVMVTGDIAALYAQATSAGTKYLVALKDGTSYDISEVAENIYFNNEVNAYNFNEIDSAKQKDSAVRIQYDAAGKVIRVDIYQPVTVDADGLSAYPPVPYVTTFTVDGVSVPTLPADAAAYIYIVTWDVEQGVVKNINAVSAAQTKTNIAVVAKGSDMSGNYIQIAEDDTKYFFGPAVGSMFNEIQVGDKVTFSFTTDAWDTTFITDIKVTEPVDPGDDPVIPTDAEIDYINTTGTRIVMSGTTYATDDDTIVYDSDGKVIAIGSADIVANKDDLVGKTVDNIVVSDGVLVSLKLAEED